MAGLVPAIHVLHHPRMSGGWVYIMASAPNGILFVGVDERSRQTRLRTSEWAGRRLHQKIFCQASRLFRVPRKHSGRDSAGAQHQALVAQMEGEADPG